MRRLYATSYHSYKGIVQGVGFRPFVYNFGTAFKTRRLGSQYNFQGVQLEIEGGDEEVAAFLDELKNSQP